MNDQGKPVSVKDKVSDAEWRCGSISPRPTG